MKASEFVKSLGIKSLAELSQASGIERRTLNDWYHHRPAAFRLLCIGMAAERASVQWAQVPDGGRG
jgi:hypothetical protein